MELPAWLHHSLDGLVSQPMDIMDGYDLLDAKGKRMLFETLRVHRPYCVIVAFDCKLWSLLNNLKSDPEMLQEMRETIGRKSLKLVVEICIWQHDHGRFFLVENPAGSLAWVWEDLLRRLLSRCLAKFVISDQCAYGKVDLESGKPIRKPTGWLSNDEVLLNHLGKRCTCKWGSHQLVLGNNKFGRRSSQAAAYPVGLCKAICQGVLDSMKIGYASRVVKDLRLQEVRISSRGVAIGLLAEFARKDREASPCPTFGFVLPYECRWNAL